MVTVLNRRKILSWSFSPLLFLLISNFSWSQQAERPKKVLPDSTNSNGDSLTRVTSYITVAANPDLKGTGLKKMLIGKNYRREWTQPIRVPVINLAAEQIKPTREGGGKQTRSLKAEDQNGNEYSLRSIKKYPEKAVPEELKNSIAEKIVTDGISASYPYAAFSMEVLSIAAGVPYLKRKLVWIGDDPGLGEFRSKYKNALVQLEESRPSGNLPPALAKKDKIESFDTEEVILKLQASSKYKVDQVSVLQARLLDNFVMNFDRHEGQWDWAGYDSLDSGIFVVIPKDADQVFFINQGLIPKIAKGTIPEIQGFRKKAKDQVTFNRSAINFDNFFLNSLNKEQWKTAIGIFLQSMTDSVIELALHQQPKEIHQYSVPKIIRTLKERRKHFMTGMMKYYAHLAKEVSILGSNEAEFFKVFTNTDGRMLVTITGEHGNGIYERVFDPKETREIRLYGLEGNDQFQIDGEKSPIKIRIIGGPGEDQFINNADEGKIWVYDLEIEHNSINGSHEVKNRISADPMVNEYKRLGYVFDRKGFAINSEVGFDGGLYYGLRYRSITQGFRKEPYAARHDFIVGHDLTLNSFLFRYNADLIKTFGKTDLLIRSEYFMPTARTNFFGLGNESVYDKSNGNGIQYYRARYELANISVLARTPINSWIDVRYGPSFQYFKLRKEENEGKYITRYDHTSNGDLPHQSHVYGGGELQFNVNTKNNVIIPTRGIALKTSIRSLVSLKGSPKNLTQLNSTLSIYSDFLAKDHLVLATRFGFAHNIGEYEFVQANYLGFRENLRGYRIHRFGGRTRAYNNLEFRWKMGQIQTFLFPITVGLIAFNDVGRVWIENESSSTWHNGYGGGIWIAPINRIVITGTLSYSDEERNFPWITIGFQF